MKKTKLILLKETITNLSLEEFGKIFARGTHGGVCPETYDPVFCDTKKNTCFPCEEEGGPNAI